MNPSHLPRSSGILLHLSSLPGPFGIGDLGPAAHRFVDLLARIKQTWWQFLPLGPPAIGGCPYQCFSAMAGNPNLISPELLRQDGLLDERAVEVVKPSARNINFFNVAAAKSPMFTSAWYRFQSDRKHFLRGEFEKFREAEWDWLADFSLFMALKSVHQDRPWACWPRELVLRKPAALKTARRDLADLISRHEFTQFLFFRQLAALRAHATKSGVKLIGDIPIFVAGESADVWSNPELFQLNRDRRPTFVAGVPPDYFSETGQRWGNPLYNWPAMKRDGFRWWIARVKMALRQADLVRIDHFRGFSASWTIPAAAKTAEHGQWVESPGHELFQTLRGALAENIAGKKSQRKVGQKPAAGSFPPLPFIAEDLGLITPDVEILRDDFALPGMRVLQFAFGGDSGNPFLPHNFIPHSVAYTATHDNDTTIGWHKSLDSKTRKHLDRYAPQAVRDPAGALMRLAWSSVARVAIAPLQDILRLGSETRMNVPGIADGNWFWRVNESAMKSAKFDQLAELTETYNRANCARTVSPVPGTTSSGASSQSG